MESEHNASYIRPEKHEEDSGSHSRLTDEKISDDSGSEANADRVFAPAELDNPFWR